MEFRGQRSEVNLPACLRIEHYYQYVLVGYLRLRVRVRHTTAELILIKSGIPLTLVNSFYKLDIVCKKRILYYISSSILYSSRCMYDW